jgi:hypothetical protein
VSAVTAIQDIEAGRSILGRDPAGEPSRFGRTPTTWPATGGVAGLLDLRRLPLDAPRVSQSFATAFSVNVTSPVGSVSRALGSLVGGGTAPGHFLAGIANGSVQTLIGSGGALAVANGSVLTFTNSGGALVGGGPALTIIGGSGSALTSYVGSSDDATSVLARCCELLQSRRGLLRPYEIVALERQLIALLSDADEIAESELTVSMRSLDGLIEFLAEHRPRVHPRLSLTRAGLFAASWSPHPRAKLTLTFTPDAAEWVGVDLVATPPARGAGAFVIGALAGMPQPFRGWIVD